MSIALTSCSLREKFIPSHLIYVCSLNYLRESTILSLPLFPPLSLSLSKFEEMDASESPLSTSPSPPSSFRYNLSLSLKQLHFYFDLLSCLQLRNNLELIWNAFNVSVHNAISTLLWTDSNSRWLKKHLLRFCFVCFRLWFELLIVWVLSNYLINWNRKRCWAF